MQFMICTHFINELMTVIILLQLFWFWYNNNDTILLETEKNDASVKSYFFYKKIWKNPGLSLHVIIWNHRVAMIRLIVRLHLLQNRTADIYRFIMMQPSPPAATVVVVEGDTEHCNRIILIFYQFVIIFSNYDTESS